MTATGYTTTQGSLPVEIDVMVSGFTFVFTIHSHKHWVTRLGPPFFKQAADILPSL